MLGIDLTLEILHRITEKKKKSPPSWSLQSIRRDRQEVSKNQYMQGIKGDNWMVKNKAGKRVRKPVLNRAVREGLTKKVTAEQIP